jgi:hypothetical protein
LSFRTPISDLANSKDNGHHRETEPRRKTSLMGTKTS